MKKTILILIFVLMAASYVNATLLEECQRTMTRKDMPCIVSTSYLPTKPCMNYPVTILNQQNATVDTIVFYSTLSSCQFVFNQPSENIYYWKSEVESGQITVNRENNMIAIILVFIILITYFTVLGIINQYRSMQFLCFGLGIIELILMVATIYVSEDAGDYTVLLRINFYSILIIGFGLGMLTFFIKNAEIVSDYEIMPMENKWGKDKWE